MTTIHGDTLHGEGTFTEKLTKTASSVDIKTKDGVLVIVKVTSGNMCAAEKSARGLKGAQAQAPLRTLEVQLQLLWRPPPLPALLFCS